MEIKIIKLLSNTATEKDAEILLRKEGWNCIKLSVDRRYKKKHLVLEALRNHKVYLKDMKTRVLFEGYISLMNDKEAVYGSPDFLIWNSEEIYFCEFKSYKDVFRLNQIEWFERFNFLPLAFAICVGKETFI